ncbi:MAG: TolC family outer membrane protein [Burkholderiaceae bacterium]
MPTPPSAVAGPSLPPGRIASSLVAASCCALAAPALALDLADAYRQAQANDPQLASARANLDAVRERITQARSQLLPMLGAQAQVSRQQAETNLSPQSEFSSRLYGVNLTMPLFRPQNLTQWDQAKLQADIADAQVSQAGQDLMIRVSQAYFDVLAAEDSLATIRAQRRAITEQLSAAKRNFEVGTATITDQQEAQARFDLNVAQELAADNDLAVKRGALSLLTGQPLSPLKALDKGVALAPPEPAQETAWTASGRQSNLSVVQSELAAEIGRREIDRARQGHYPTLDLVGSVGRQYNPSFAFQGVTVDAKSIGLQLNVPIYAGGGIEAKVREAIALRNKALSDVENYRRQAEQGARTAYLGVQSGLGQVRALEAAERSSQLALDSNLLGYQVGVRINIDVLNAQQQLYSTRRDLARARYDVLVNGLRLRQAAGTLAEADLMAVNDLLSTVQEPAGEPQR